jgi:hypothetical protein
MVSRETKRGRVSWLRRGAGAEDIGEHEGGGCTWGRCSVGGWRLVVGIGGAVGFSA